VRAQEQSAKVGRVIGNVPGGTEERAIRRGGNAHCRPREPPHGECRPRDGVSSVDPARGPRDNRDLAGWGRYHEVAEAIEGGGGGWPGRGAQHLHNSRVEVHSEHVATLERPQGGPVPDHGHGTRGVHGELPTGVLDLESRHVVDRAGSHRLPGKGGRLRGQGHHSTPKCSAERATEEQHPRGVDCEVGPAVQPPITQRRGVAVVRPAEESVHLAPNHGNPIGRHGHRRHGQDGSIPTRLLVVIARSQKDDPVRVNIQVNVGERLQIDRRCRHPRHRNRQRAGGTPSENDPLGTGLRQRPHAVECPVVGVDRADPVYGQGIE